MILFKLVFKALQKISCRLKFFAVVKIQIIAINLNHSLRESRYNYPGIIVLVNFTTTNDMTTAGKHVLRVHFPSYVGIILI